MKFKKIVQLLLIVLLSLTFFGCKENTDDVTGYTIKGETCVDTADLVPVDGYYVGKGSLNGSDHYIFQVQKDGKVSDNVDALDSFVEINYIDGPATKTNSDTNKTQTAATSNASQNQQNIKPYVKAFYRTYEKDGHEKGKYAYKLYITHNSIKDCGQLSNSNDNSDDTE